MKKLTYILLTGLFTILYTSSIFAQGDLISAADFMKMFKTNKNLVIIDASKADSYTKTHVKDAVNIPYKTLNAEGEIEGLLKSTDELANIFGENGVSETKTIVVYDGGSQKYSSRVYWVLKYLGAPDVKILHKDMDEWRKARVPITKMPTRISKVTFSPKVNANIIADMAYVESGKATLIDARSVEEFDGTSEKSAGHIPGSLNLHFKDIMTSTDAFKSKSELEGILASHKITDGKPIVVYCNTGVVAAVVYVALTDIMGWTNVKVYDGAYKEWEAKGKKFKNKDGVLTTKKEGNSGGGC